MTILEKSKELMMKISQTPIDVVSPAMIHEWFNELDAIRTHIVPQLSEREWQYKKAIKENLDKGSVAQATVIAESSESYRAYKELKLLYETIEAKNQNLKKFHDYLLSEKSY
jgi:hypothetical protein